MEYSVTTANVFIGKRVIVSLRYIGPNNEESFGGVCGVIDSVHEGGLLMIVEVANNVEDVMDDKFWMFPPDLDALEPPSNKFYQMDGSDTVITDVDFEAYFSLAGTIEQLDTRS